MSIIIWIILGLIAGYIASKIVNKTGEGSFSTDPGRDGETAPRVEPRNGFDRVPAGKRDVTIANGKRR